MKKWVLAFIVLFVLLSNVAFAEPPSILGCNIGSPCDLDGLVRGMGREREMTGPVKLDDMNVDRFVVQSFEDDENGNWLTSQISISFKPDNDWKSNFAALKKYAHDHFHIDSVTQSYESVASANFYAKINAGYVVYIDSGRGMWSTLVINKARTQ